MRKSRTGTKASSNLIAKIFSALALVCAASLFANSIHAARQTLHLHLIIMTGDAGLYENSQLDAVVRLPNGKNQTFILHEPHTTGWKPHTTFQQDLDLKRQHRGVSIVGIMLEFHQAGSDTDSHPWNMQGIIISDREGAIRKMVKDMRGAGEYDCVMRFTGSPGASTYFIPL